MNPMLDESSPAAEPPALHLAIDNAADSRESPAETAPRSQDEAGFTAPDGARLYYRHWAPAAARAGERPRGVIVLHRGHEHAGRVAALVDDLGLEAEHVFAWDMRGHGHSPGPRGHAPGGFMTWVGDLDAFVSHVCARHGVAQEDLLVVANSVGAVVAATWIHDYAPRIRGVVMAAAAFEIKLYVPLALPALRLGLAFKPELEVTSYIRPTMLTHSADEARDYGSDPLVTKQISARVLVEMARTARRIVQDAAAIDVPVMLLVADTDYVVKAGPQEAFFQALSSPLKRLVRLADCRHAIFYESSAVRDEAIAHTRRFLDACRAQPVPDAGRHVVADIGSASARAYQALVDGRASGLVERAAFAFQRVALRTLGRLSAGMTIGLTQGFDSGASLDHVYRNVATGRTPLGRMIDRGYLDAVGWRGIRLRRQHLQRTLSALIEEVPPGLPVRILDLASGQGRYLLETVKCHGDRDLRVTLRDLDPANLEAARAHAAAIGLDAHVETRVADAFDENVDKGDLGRFDIVVVSGLYELFAENAPVLRSLKAAAKQLRPGGALVYTGQPWHPQLRLIAGTLGSLRGGPWRMRPRPQAELDGLVSCAGLSKASTLIGLEGIFTVSVARRPLAPD